MRKTNNNVQLTGHIGNDPKIIEFKNGNRVAKLQIAINEHFKTKSGKSINKTQWQTLSAWGSLATLIKKNFKKGNTITVSGSLNNRSYLDKKGIVRSITEVNCHHVELNRA